MDGKQQKARQAGDLSRRDLMRGGAVAAAGLAVGGMKNVYADSDVTKTRSYNPDMKYRPLGKTGLWISEACLGGHWKRVDKMVPGLFRGKGWINPDLNNGSFKKNRRDVVTRCIEHGINYIDACTRQEILAYAEALRGRRDAMYFGFSWYQEEMRKEPFRTTEALLGTLEKGMREAKLDYVDLWRITMHEQSSRHTDAEVDEMMGALEKGAQTG